MRKKEQKQEKVYAFIDSQNINLSVQHQGWVLDWKRFRVYLKDQYNVEEAFLFIGKMPQYQSLYDALASYGYKLIFKPILKYRNGKVKGNVDAELVLHAMIQFKNYHKAVIVSGDGDFHCLIEYLNKKDKLERLVIPNKNSFSALLREFADKSVYLTDLEKKVKLDKRLKRKV